MTLADGKKWEDEEEIVTSAFVGEDVFIEMRLEPEETRDHFVLFRGDQPIASERYNVQTRGNVVQLTLKQANKDDTGHYALVAKKLSKNYTLSAENDDKEGPRRRIRMNIREASDNPEEGEPPVFVRRLTDLAVKVGTRTRFLVEIRSSSSPKITWHRNDHPIQAGSRFSFVHEGNFFCVDVAPVMVEDQGHWTCMVENVNGRSSCTSCLSVIVPKAYKPPEFVEELRALLTETGTVSLECKVVGVPTPVLRWFKDDKEIKAGDVFALTANADDPTSLGTYTCQAVNCMGTAYSSSKVHVVGRGSREGSLKPADTLVPSGPLPVFKKILKDESCKIGENLTLSCQVKVPPWPKVIIWYNKEGKVEPNEKYHVMEDGLGTYSIEVSGAEAMDEGEWKCVATSAENVMQFTTCFVAMSIPKNYRVPRFMESLKAVLTEEGLVSFECKVVGFPTPLLRWFKDGQELKPGDVYQLTGTNSLGSYCCIARNCMGEAKSTAELTVEDIQNQLNEEERLQLMSHNQVPKFIKGLRSCEARIHEEFTFTVQVSISPAPTLSWYRDDEPIIENEKYKMIREVLGTCHLEVHKLEFIDQAEWKCVAANDFGHSVTSCFLKLIIPKHFKKPKFLENLRAILSEEGAVNLECKVIGVPQPILKWYKDGVELKPGDIHRIISGQDGTCCLGTYTCEATNCMGSVSSSASLLGFEDRVALRKEETTEPSSPVLHELARNLSLSTIHEERTSQLYDTPQTDHSITLDDRGEVSFSFDGKEVSVSLYETPDLTEEEAIQIVEMYADQLSEHITEGNVIELPPMRFMKETSTTGNLLMEAVVIDVSPDYFADEEADDLRTEADVEDVSIMDDQMQSLLSSYSPPPGEHSGEQTPVGSPPPRPPRRKERSGSASSKSEKSEKSQHKVFDWSESYHSAKEPSMQAQLSLHSQDSVDAFADALSSEGLAKACPKERSTAKESVNKIQEDIDIDEDISVVLLHSPELTEEVFAAALKESIEEESSAKRKRRKRRSKGETPVLSSKTSSEDSYTMGAEAYEPEEKIKRRGSKEGKEKRERKDSTGSNKSNKSTTSKKEKKKRRSQELKEQSLKIEAIRLEKSEVFETPQVMSQAGEQYGEENDGLLEERPTSTASSGFTTAGDISEQSITKSQKERLFENVKSLSDPVLVLRNTLVDLDNILTTSSGARVDEEKLQALIVERIVRPVENLCEKMSVIETKAVKAAGDRSLAQGIRISLVDSIGGPTEELLRGIDLIKRHRNKTPEDLKSDLIILESLTDPVDEILAGLAKIKHELRGEEGLAEPSSRPENPIILERMTRTISRLGTNIEDFLRNNQKTPEESEVVAIAERLDSLYQNVQSFLTSLPLDKITSTLESNVDTLVLETLIKPLEGLVRILNTASSSPMIDNDQSTIGDLQKAVIEVKNKLETLTVALETYEAESGEAGITERHLELVNYLKWTMDDTSDKLLKIKNSRKSQECKVDDDMLGSVPVSSDEEWKLDQGMNPQKSTKIEEAISPQLPQDVGSIKEEIKTPIIEEKIPEASKIQPIGPIDVKRDNEEIMKDSKAVKKFVEVETSNEDQEMPVEEIKLETPETNKSKDTKSKRAKYKRQVTSLDSAPAELDETLPLPEMLLDPLIDVQAKLNIALHHYENQNPTDESSLPSTELSNCLTELRESIASAAHVAMTLNVSDTLNSIIDLREPLLDLQLALSPDPSPQEFVLVEEITQPLNELNEIVCAVTRSSTPSDSSKVILKQVSRMIDDIQEQLPKMSERKISLETQVEPIIGNVEAIKPPEDVEHASLAFSGVHFALSSALEKAHDYAVFVNEEKTATTVQRLISSIETLRECVGALAVSIATPTVPKENTSEYNYNIVFEELEKLQEPLLNLQKILLTEQHQPEERHVLNNVSSPLKALKEAIFEVTNGKITSVLELLEDVEKDVSLVAMEALKKALVGTIASDDPPISDSTPGEVPGIVSRWLDPIENWLTTASEDVENDEKEIGKSAVAPVVDELKKQLLEVAIQSSYSEPPSDVALIEKLAGLKEPLSRVCEFIASHHDPADLEVMESLIQPTKHLLGTILDTSLIHQASSVLRPVLETLEELENQIPLSIKMAKYEQELQKVVKSMTPDKFEQEAEKFSPRPVEIVIQQNTVADVHQLEHAEVSNEAQNVEIMTEPNIQEVNLAETISSHVIVEDEGQKLVHEGQSLIPEVSQTQPDNVQQQKSTEKVKTEELSEFINSRTTEVTNDDLSVDEELLKRRESEIASAVARAEELDLWTLTILGPLDRLASTALSLDRSIDEEVHTILCRPLDSLHKQIELVESQINRPAGQSLDNDVETIIEGFLSPVNQVQTALRTAVKVWQRAPAKEAVRRHLQEMVESSSDLCERLESLKNKLVTESSTQTLQVQKAEASLVETITAVLGPLQGIRELIAKMLEECIVETKEESGEDAEVKRGEHVVGESVIVEEEETGSKDDVKHIEQATARPLEELIEAIVDPTGIRHTSTTSDEMQAAEITSQVKNEEEKITQSQDFATTKEEAVKIGNQIVDEVELLVAEILTPQKAEKNEEQITESVSGDLNEQKIELVEAPEVLQSLPEPQDTIIKQEIKELIAESPQEYQEHASEENISDIVTKELQKETVQPITIENLPKASLQKIQQTFLQSSTENQALDESIHNLVVEELQKQNIEPSANRDLVMMIEEKTHDVVLNHPATSQEDILEEIIHDTVQESHEKNAAMVNPENLDKSEQIRSQALEEEAISAVSDITVFTNRIRDISRNELDRQNALSFESESLMENIEAAVRGMMIKCSQICQENVFEESVRDIVVEELQKVKEPRNQDSSLPMISNIEVKDYHQTGATRSMEFPEEKIHDFVLDELHKQTPSISSLDEDKLVKIVEAKVQSTILACSQIAQDNTLEESIHEIIVEEVRKQELEGKPTESLVKAEEIIAEVKMDTQTAEAMLVYIPEGKIHDIVMSELQKQHVQPLEGDYLSMVVEAKVQKMILVSPEVLQEGNLEGNIRDIVAEELQNAKAVEEDDFAKAETINPEVKVDVQDLGATSAHITEEKIHDIILDEIQKQNAQPVDQDSFSESVIAKVQEKIYSSPQLSDENVPEETIRDIVLDEIEKQKAELKDSQGGNKPEKVNISHVDTKISEEAVALEQDQQKTEAESQEIMKVKLEESSDKALLVEETPLQSSEVSQEHIPQETIGEFTTEGAEKQKILSKAVEDLGKAEEVIVLDIEVREHETEITPSRTAIISKEETSDERIQQLIIDEIDKQEVKSSVRDDFIKAMTTKIQDIIINCPEVSTEENLRASIRDIIVKELEEQKAKILATEGLIEVKSTEVKVKALEAASESQTEVPEQLVHDMVIKELHKQNVTPAEEENLMTIVETKIQNLIKQHPEVSEAKAMDERVQEVVTETMEQQKANISAGESLVRADEQKTKVDRREIASTTTQEILQEVVHELIVEELQKQHVQPSEEDNLSKAIESRVQELINQYPEVSKPGILEENVHEITIKVLEEQKLNLIESKNLSASKELDHDLIVEEIHKENLSPSEENILVKAAESRVQDLTTQHPEISKEEILEENVQDIIVEELNEQKAETLETARLFEADQQEIKVEPPRIRSPTRATLRTIQQMVDKELYDQRAESSERDGVAKAVEVKIQTLIEANPELSKEDFLEERIREIVTEELKAQKVDDGKELAKAKEQEGKANVLKTPLSTEIKFPEEIVHDLIIGELHKRNVSPLEENKLSKAVEIKVQDLIAQHPEISTVEILHENIQEIIIDELKEQTAKIGDAEQLSQAQKQERKSEILNTPSAAKFEVSQEVVHDIIIEELHKQNVLVTEEDALSNAIETKIQALIRQYPEISTEETLQENVQKIVVEELKEQKATVSDSDKLFEAQKQKIKPKILKAPSATKIEVSEEVVHDMIIEELHKQNVLPSEEDNLSTAVEVKVQALIAQHPEMLTQEILQENIQDIVVDELKEQKPRIGDADKLSDAQEQGKRPNILNSPSAAKIEVSEEVVHDMIVMELHKQNVLVSEEDALSKAIETKLRALIVQHPEISTEETLKENVQKMVVQEWNEQKAKVGDTDKLLEAQKQEKKPKILKAPSATEIEISEEVVHDMVIEELHKQNILPSKEEHLSKAVETKVQNFIAQHPTICTAETLQESVHKIVIDELEEQKAEFGDMGKLSEMQVQEKQLQILKTPFASKIEVSEEAVHEMVMEELHKQNVLPSEEDNLSKAIENKVQALIARHPDISEDETLQENVQKIVVEELKEQKATVSDSDNLSEAQKQKIKQKVLKAPSATEIEVSEEVIHDIILEELHKLKVLPSEEDNLSKAVEVKVQALVAQHSEMFTQETLQEKVQKIIVDELKEQKARIGDIENLSAAEEQGRRPKILKTQSAAKIEVSEEVIHDMVIEELHKRNVQPSKEDDFSKANETKVQALIAQHPEISTDETVQENVQKIVVDELKKQKAKVGDAEKPSEAQKQEINPKILKTPPVANIDVSEEVIHGMIIEQLHKQNVLPSEEDNLSKAIKRKVQALIAQHPESYTEEILQENVQKIVVAELKGQKVPIYDSDKLSEAQVHEGKPKISETPSTAKMEVPEEVIHDLIIDELHKQKVQPSQEGKISKAIEAKVHEFIAQHPESSKEDTLKGNIHAIITEALKEHKITTLDAKDITKVKKKKMKAEDFKMPSTTQAHVPEEIVHELIIEELHKQNVQQSDETNLVKAIESKLQDLIAQHPEVSKEDVLEESVRDIITEKLEEQKAIILEAERLARVNQQGDKVEVLNVPSSTHVEVPEEIVHEMVIEEFHKQNIEPSAEGNLVKAVEAKIRDLIAQHPKVCKDDILEGSVREIVTEIRAEQKANIMDTEGLVKASQHSIKVEISQAPKAQVPEAVVDEIITEKVPKQQEASKDEILEKSTEDKDQDQPDKHSDKIVKKKPVEETIQAKAKETLEKDMTKITQCKAEHLAKEELEHKKKEVAGELKEEKLPHAERGEEHLVQETVESSQEALKNEQREDMKHKNRHGNVLEQPEVQERPQRQSRVAPTISTDTELDSEISESSRSTLKDISFDERPKRNIPPSIEIDCDHSLPKEPSSRRSNMSSKRYRDQQAFDLDDKSIGVYSSATSRVRGFSPGPRDRGKKPSFCTKLTDRTAAEASRIKLTCTVLGEPEPQVYWLKDGRTLPPSSNRHCTTIENGMVSLELYAVKPKDSGEYSCIAENLHGQACTEAKLKVYAGYEPTPTLPTFTRSIKDHYRSEENALILECRVRGQPSPTITWLKDGQVLEISDRYQQSDLADGICRLKIFNPDFYDSGLYTCRAENDTRLSDRTSHLVNFQATGREQSAVSWRGSGSYHDVTSTDKDTGRPRFSSYLTDHSVPAGGTIALQVEVKGVPPPEITWMRADKRGPISVPKARTFADSGVYTLIVPDATDSETGTYVCRASNAYGHVDTIANVEVVSGNTMDGGKPAMFVSRPPDKHIIVAVGEDVSVSFRTTGVPKPRVIWMKGLRDITCGPRSYKEGHDDYVRLTLKRACPSDEGTYCILLKNRYGCDRSFFTVQVKQRARSLTPSPDWGPVDTDNLLANIHDKERSYLKQVPGPISSEPVVIDGGRNWLALTWGKAEQRGPAPVVAYRVDAWLLGGEGGARWAELGVTPINAFDAFNLRPGEEYKFRITPRNRYGWGDPVTMNNSVTVREVVKFPEFTKILPGQLKALSGTILNLDCEVASDSIAHVKWYRDTTEIENGQDSRFTTYFNSTKCTLMIGNILENDSGRYVCEATNAAGRVSTFARVQVVEDPKIVEADSKLRKMRSSEIANEERPPEFTMRLRDRRVQATYPVRLTCQVTGYPEPEVTWYKYREELLPHDNVAIWNDEAHFHTLEISRSTIDDSGIYMARAKNAYGSVSCRCHLVVDKGIRAYIAPEFLGHLDQVYTVKAGRELRMTAQVEAYPTVGITWHRDGHRLRPSRDVVMTLNHDGTIELELAHVTSRDAGLYCCTATNEVGRAESITRVTVLESDETKHLKEPLPDVVESPDIPYSKEPLFVTKPLSTEAFEGDTVIILCEVVGDPKPEVMWLRDFLRPDYYKDAPHFRRVGAGPQYRLEIPYAKLDFTGAYSIIAKNCHGEAKAVISLQIYARGQGKEDSSMESTIKHGNVQTLPMIKRPLRDLRCCDGDAVTLVCKVRATPKPNVRWEKGGKLLPLGSDFTTDYDGETARLSIQHVYPEDEGEYTCVAYNDLGKAYTSACLIVDVPEGKETALSRRLTKPSGLLSPNSTPISTPRSTPVRSLSPSCTSRRELKPSTKTSRSQIGGRRPRMPVGPKFYAVPHNRVAEEGETVRFQCAVAGHPAPWVTWDKDGVSVTPTTRISLKENDDVRILEITEVTHEDAGLYRVTLENDVGRTEATARLEIIRGRHNSVSRSIGTRSASPRTYSIYGRSHLSPSPRSDSRLQPPRLSDAYSRRGGTISPTLPRWHHRNGKQSAESSDNPVKNRNLDRNKVVRSSSIPRQSLSEKKYVTRDTPGSPMRFRKIKSPETSKKLVKATNTLSTSSNAPDKRKMLSKLDKKIPKNCKVKEDNEFPAEIRPPVILAAPADVIALRGAKVMLLATYDGYPRPIVRWLRKGQNVTLDDKTEIETGAGLTCLTLMNVTTEEAGRYEVRIENTGGRDSKYVNVTVEGPPEPPAGKPTVQSITRSGTITLTWRSPVYDGGCAVTGYSVEMRRGEEPCWIAVAEARHSLSHTVHQLESEESYRFRVRAENVHGSSEPGMESNVFTIPSADAEEMTEKAFGLVSEPEEEDEDDFEPAFEARVVSPESGHHFEERYDVLEELGKGRYGIVRRIFDKTTGLNLAAKFVRTIKSKDRQQVHDEINIMNTLRHPKLLRLAAAFEGPKEMIMVTEYISGGELFERVVADDFTLTEKDSILFVRQICQGVEYMHDNRVVHLDLKPENIMCHTRTSHRIKLIDFGLAQTLKPDTPVRVLFGTPEFIPPEIIGFEPIGTESDMWSVGVICYVLLTGLSPFMGENDAETFANITRADYDFDDKAFHAISQEAKDFISALLVKRKELRMSAKECLKHPWLAQCAESMSRVALPTDKLKKFIVRRKWQKTGNAIRALGRMAILSANSRKNVSSNPPSPKPLEDDEKQEIFVNDLHEELNVEDIDHVAHPTPVDSPEEIYENPLRNRNVEHLIEDEINDESLDELQATIDLSLDEYLETNSISLDNAESSPTLDTQRSCTPDDYTRVESITFKIDKTDNTTSEPIYDDLTTDFAAEFRIQADEGSSENDTTITEVDSSIDENLVTFEISPTTLKEIAEEREENYGSSFCSMTNLEINAAITETSEDTDEIIVHKETKTEIRLAEALTEESQEDKASMEKVARPNFIPLQDHNNQFESVSKPWCKINPSALDDEDEVSRLTRRSPLHRGVRTGSVSRTAKIFEQEEASSPIRQAISPGSRIVLPTSDARPQNDRIRKAFAFWNK